MTTTSWVLLLMLVLVSVVALWAGLRLRQAEQSTRLYQPLEAPPTHGDDTIVPNSMAGFSSLFDAVASSIDSGLVVVNTERRVRFINTQAEELLGVDGHSVRNQGLITLLRDYQADTLVQDVLHDNEAREETIHSVSGGRTLHIRCAALKPNGTTSGALLIIRDVTQISILERSRRELVANVSHELRTPLTSLKLLLETVQSEPPPDVTRRMLGQMAQEIDVVTQLVDELHELSQIESGRVTLQLAPGSISHAIESTLQRIQPQAERKNIQIHARYAEGDSLVLMDEKRMSQVLLNLLHNAVKFTPDGGTITVQTCSVSLEEPSSRMGTMRHKRTGLVESLVAAPNPYRPFMMATPLSESSNKEQLPSTHPSGRWVVTHITDTGIGIPSQDLPRIFERFYKVDRSRTQTGGTGLGLAIAKHLIEGHGGRLWASSEEGRGSVFSFTLPAA